MIKFSTILCCLFLAVRPAKAQIQLDSTTIDTSTVLQGLHVPWEILWGPDNRIWFTERSGHVSAIDPATRVKKRLLSISDVYEFSESGLLGMALHPGFGDTPHVFLVYNFLFSAGVVRERLVRYTWSQDTLKDPLVLLTFKGNYNHNGSRIIIMPDRKIIMSTGDAQFSDSAQNVGSLSGKFLRLNLDGSVPSDNPIPGSLIWSWGHRNPQGLVRSPNGKIYSSEHGASDDDEINILKPNRNFGWPNVQGFCDLPSEAAFCAANNVAEPVKTWSPTLAIAGIDYYDHPAIPEWRNCIFMTSLKGVDLRVLQLDASGDIITGERIYFDNVLGRLRDVCVSPMGSIYVSTSNQDGRASAGFPKVGDDRIVELKAHGYTGIGQKSIADQLQIFPNPFNNSLRIRTGMLMPAHTQLLISDIFGREMLQQEILSGETITIQTENWKNGFYFYHISNGGRIEKSGKLLLQR